MKTRAADDEVLRSGGRPLEQHPEGAPTCAPQAPVWGGIAVAALAVTGATAVGLRWAEIGRAHV